MNTHATLGFSLAEKLELFHQHRDHQLHQKPQIVEPPMSLFLCICCDRMADSDEGCEEYVTRTGKKTHQLICADCIAERDEDEEDRDLNPWEGRRDMSYGGIYRTLKDAGCPDDIARELAKEKSK